ncbi:hypothetical protein ASE86_14900 [Sphingomonas sp. Leaf33]|uniref:sterol desaturase family protein n=1 Tax=Sphingomonas sp. Leaf33 TaxID=1736215 RepID=UPI00071518AE|nr:sterol desaturase family protein [Sphingomonas sp. Leaf33]KQN21250.1 hypothetical protein ASE86_14900 [Sphingomonas sp. Leaf33]
MTADQLASWLGAPMTFWSCLFAILVGTAAWELLAEGPSMVSAEAGDRRMVTNVALGILWLGLSALVPTTVTSLAAIAKDQGIGLFAVIGLSGWPAFLGSLLVLDAGQYGLHRLSHRWQWLWRLHRVHHSDTALDITTTFRHHPGELLVALAWMSMLGLVFGLSASAVPVYALVVLLLSVPQHADASLNDRTEAFVSRFIATPGLHRVHHGANVHDTDTNYGEVLIVWDWLFRTLRHHSPVQRQTMRVGLGPHHDVGADSLIKQLTGPLLR